jgi:hypothetical protein
MPPDDYLGAVIGFQRANEKESLPIGRHAPATEPWLEAVLFEIEEELCGRGPEATSVVKSDFKNPTSTSTS